MKKIIIVLMLLIGSFAYSYNDETANKIMELYNKVEGSDYSADKERVEEILREPYGTFGSPFDIDGDYVLSTGDFILQMSTLIAYDGIYNWDIAKLRKDRPSIDKYSKDFHYKFSPEDGCIIWCIPSAHCMGMVEVVSGSVYLLGIDTGEPSYYKGYYGLNSLHTKYSMKIETARDYDKELYKVICEINDVKVGD
jgi:hypothetical protein